MRDEGLIGLNKNRHLNSAAKAKKDEFYTQLTDIERELWYYRPAFRGKIVLCNCDDPYESEFFKYFAMQFNSLGLKKLIATCYDGSPIAQTELSLFDDLSERRAFKLELTEVRDWNGDGAIDLKDVEEYLRRTEIPTLEGNGDFRSPECIELLKEADIVVTNPPFSLFREYVAQLIEYEKQFLIIGNQNAITYKEIFPLLMQNKMWLGASIHSGDREMRVPDHYEIRTKNTRTDEKGIRYVRVPSIRWFTNIDYARRHEDIPLWRKYSPEEYPRYDNYDAIEVSKTADIPIDYDGVMGVPITFMDKYNPEQFEILGITSGREEFEARPTKKYINAVQHNLNGTTTTGSKVNTRSAFLQSTKPSGVYYTADNADGFLTVAYARILIRRRRS